MENNIPKRQRHPLIVIWRCVCGQVTESHMYGQTLTCPHCGWQQGLNEAHILSQRREK